MDISKFALLTSALKYLIRNRLPKRENVCPDFEEEEITDPQAPRVISGFIMKIVYSNFGGIENEYVIIDAFDIMYMLDNGFATFMLIPKSKQTVQNQVAIPGTSSLGDTSQSMRTTQFSEGKVVKRYTKNKKIVHSNMKLINPCAMMKTNKNRDNHEITETANNASSSHIPTYRTLSEDKRGNMLIINNVSYKQKSNIRHCSKIDVPGLKATFGRMGFDIEVLTDLSGKQLREAIRSYTQNPLLNNGDIQIVTILSHGSRNRKTYIEMIDGDRIEIQWIVDQFSNTACPYLAGKPKIFLTQCCRGTRKNIEKTDCAEVIYSTSRHTRATSDVLLAYATVPDYVCYQSNKSGSRFIQAICDIFSKHAHDTHVEDLLKMVDNEINPIRKHNKYQTSCYENRGFKRCYLNPINI